MADGDETAFRTLFHHFNRMLLPFVSSLVAPPQEPSEILQEVFYKIWMYREKLRAVENPKAYIVRMVSNEAHNYLRALARQNKLILKAQQQRANNPVTPEEQMALRETAKLVAAAIEQLTPACKQVYLLSREQHLSIPEIATQLNLSESTVKNQLVRALKDIRTYIQGNGLSTFFSFPIIF